MRWPKILAVIISLILLFVAGHIDKNLGFIADNVILFIGFGLYIFFEMIDYIFFISPKRTQSRKRQMK